MLKIENIGLLRGHVIAGYTIDKIATGYAFYQFELHDNSSKLKLAVQLERTPVGPNKLYELWYWDTKGGTISLTTAKQKRVLISKRQMRDMYMFSLQISLILNQ